MIVFLALLKAFCASIQSKAGGFYANRPFLCHGQDAREKGLLPPIPLSRRVFCFFSSRKETIPRPLQRIQDEPGRNIGLGERGEHEQRKNIAEIHLENTERKVKVNNRSDLPVYAYATITNTNDADGITVAAVNNSAQNKLTVAKATAGSGSQNGTSTVKELVINLTSDNWNAVAEYYAAQRLASQNQETDTFRIATVTVTISKD